MTRLELAMRFVRWNWWWIETRRGLVAQDALIRASGKQQVAK